MAGEEIDQIDLEELVFTLLGNCCYSGSAQIGGESFVRAEVSIALRQSGRVLVEGLPPGARVVDRGGNAIRRATLVASDVGEGHVH